MDNYSIKITTATWCHLITVYRDDLIEAEWYRREATNAWLLLSGSMARLPSEVHERVQEELRK